jgi:hypothetical protein
LSREVNLQVFNSLDIATILFYREGSLPLRPTIQPGGPVSYVYVLQWQGGPVIPPDTGFPFRCLLRLSGLQWMYSNPPPLRIYIYIYIYQGLNKTTCPLKWKINTDQRKILWIYSLTTFSFFLFQFLYKRRRENLNRIWYLVHIKLSIHLINLAPHHEGMCGS